MKDDAKKGYDIFDPPAKDSIHRILKEGRKLITPNLAKRVLAEANFDGQRPIADHHVTLLAHIMKDRRWQSGGQIAFCRLNGYLMLTNGQHRMKAVVDSGIAQEFQVLITECTTMEEVEADYHRHDIIARKRSIPEIIGSTDLLETSGITKTMLSRLYQAASMLESDLKYIHYLDAPTVRDVDSRLSTVRGWLDEAAKYESLIKGAPAHVKRSLVNAGVLAVALVTLRHQPEKAEEFWQGVADDDGLRRGDPRKALLQDFESRGTTKGAFHAQRVIPAITAWNAFFEGRTLKLIKVLESSHISVRGTPIKG